MAVAQTGAIYKALSFDNVSSRTFGVYITGEAVYNAPERDVEMVTIPGRNGSFALDNGRFENITVTYPAGIFADNEADFSEAISDFRNWLCSRKGYVRLSDEYNPGEYRLAVYRSGLEVSPAQLRAGEFTISFDCKPQRFLIDGETAEAVTSGGTITNPTLFESSPLLEVKGYGNIGFNGYSISIENEVLGYYQLVDETRYDKMAFVDLIFSKSSFLTGDTITMKASEIFWWIGRSENLVSGSFSVSDSNSDFASRVDYKGDPIQFRTFVPEITFTAGTAKTVTNTATATFQFVGPENASVVVVETIEYTPNYSTNDSRIRISRTTTCNPQNKLAPYGTPNSSSLVYVNSTKSILGNPTYIDCDLGDAYKIESGTYVSLNSKITLGSQLPTLASGSNTVTFDNTVTELKIVPRWWKI